MSADGSGDAPGGYAWPGADEVAVELACVRVARHVARAGVRRIGVLPVGRGGLTVARRDLSPLLERVAGSLASLVTGEIAFIGPWTEWGARAGSTGEVVVRREVRPSVFELVPRACDEAPTAAARLEPTLASLPPTTSRVLVDLGGYGTEGGAISIAVEALEGVIIAVVVRNAHAGDVTVVVRDAVPAAKRLGAVLIE